MTRINDDRFHEAHVIEQGDYIIAANETCAVIGNGKARSVSVSFFAYRWMVEKDDVAAMHRELLKERLNDFDRTNLTGDTLVSIASMCLEHYKVGEKQGWLTEIKAQFEHDCDDCIFLGPLLDSGNMPDEKEDQRTKGNPVGVDLYYCPNRQPYPTVIARYGSEGHEYKSGLLFGMFDLEADLAEAYKRAHAYGLLNGISVPRLNVIDGGTGQVPHTARGES